jgi:hypothetical protein
MEEKPNLSIWREKWGYSYKSGANTGAGVGIELHHALGRELTPLERRIWRRHGVWSPKIKELKSG